MGLLSGLAVSLTFFIVTVHCETFLECEGMVREAFVASSQGCENYIYCDGEDSFESACPKGFMFNPEEGFCDTAENVNCKDEKITTQAPTTTVPAIISTTTTNTTNTSTLPNSVNSTTVITESTSTPAPSPDGQITCPQPSRPDEVIYLPNPDSCTDYYMCYRLMAIPLTCPNDLHFDSLTGTCVWADLANCQIVGTATTKISPRQLCTGQFSGYFPYPNKCQFYYRCTRGLLTVQECPIGFGWDVNKKLCTTTGCST